MPTPLTGDPETKFDFQTRLDSRIIQFIFSKAYGHWLKFAASLVGLAILAACRSDGPKSAEGPLPPPLPTVTVFLPERDSKLRLISLSSMIISTNILSQVDINARILVKHSPAQTAYNLYLVNAAYELWRGAPLRSNVFLITNRIASAQSVAIRTPWQFDLRGYQFCAETNCFIFSTTSLGFSNECSCPERDRLQADASDWPKLYYRHEIQRQMQMWRFGLPGGPRG